jgi:hypothetical protein
MKIKRWDNGCILIDTGESDCFLRNKSLNPLINWLNLHNAEMTGDAHSACNGEDRINEVQYSSVGGNLMIATGRDVVFLSKNHVAEFKKWLLDNKGVLKVRTVLLKVGAKQG